ncbi:MAG: competence/damage-inducible protein A [Planctomycetota bacterium]
MHTAAILIVGDEILSGEIRDENAPFLLALFAEAGIAVERVVVAPDERSAIVAEVRRLRALADAVVVSGGIGPTHDDVTRMAVAEALGLELESHPAAAERIHAWHGAGTTEAESAMALLPAGAVLVDGERTGVFGFAVGGVFALPGVPFLFRDIARTLPAHFETAPLYHEEIRVEEREGEIASLLAAAQDRAPDVAMGSYPACEDGVWCVRVILRGPDAARLGRVAADLRALLAARGEEWWS